MAELTFVYGAMNSGKSDTILKAAHGFTHRGVDILTMKPSDDKKGGAHITSRGGFSREVDLLVEPGLDVRQAVSRLIGERSLNLSRIFADESQFFTPPQIDQLFAIAKYDDIPVLAYGLRTDVYRRLFQGSHRLFELADRIEKLPVPAPCDCGREAEFNARYIDGIFDYKDKGPAETIIDGSSGSVVYTSYCGSCYDQELEMMRQKSQQTQRSKAATIE